MSQRVLVAMSGGVDSSAAALLLLEEGFSVVGVTLRLFDSCGRPSERACCALEDVSDAARVARCLGIEHRVLDHQGAFARMVIDPVVAAYASGQTPNPCILCNEKIKFGSLWDYARREGFDALATGHHARLVPRSRGGVALQRGSDAEKDQSYVLFTLTEEQRGGMLLPVGEWRKAALREKASAAGLPTADKRESQDLCFVERGSLGAFLDSNIPTPRGGVVRHVDGRVLGSHRGIHHFTVGQRRGLGIPAAEPLYVVAIRAGSREVVVGSKKDLEIKRFGVRQWNWHPPPGDRPELASVQVRYRQRARKARLVPEGGSVMVEWLNTAYPVTPGQAAVAYAGDTVLGGGWIVGARE